MSRLLDWTPVRRDDREHLRTFTCTEPPVLVRRGAHWEKDYPRPWEREVQARIRTATCAPQPPDFMLVGRDAEGVGGVVFYSELDGPGTVEIRVAALANRYRRRGGGWADEMMTETIDALTTRAFDRGVDIIEVGTWVHDRNRASQDLCRRSTLRQIGQDGELQRWGVDVLVSGASFED